MWENSSGGQSSIFMLQLEAFWTQLIGGEVDLSSKQGCFCCCFFWGGGQKLMPGGEVDYYVKHHHNLFLFHNLMAFPQNHISYKQNTQGSSITSAIYENGGIPSSALSFNTNIVRG